MDLKEAKIAATFQQRFNDVRTARLRNYFNDV